MAPNQKNIDPLSVRSLLLEVKVNDHKLGNATGFVVLSGGQPYLITNWHVVSGRNPETDEVISDTGGIPDEIQVVHHSSNNLGEWVVKSERLHDEDGNERWVEHPQGREVDVVALPLSNVGNEVEIYEMDLSLAQTDMMAQPAMPVSIIGFPYGLASAGALPVWKTGHIASDPDLNYQGSPAFLIDATTREGMSGSPVVLRLTGGYRDSSGNLIMASGQRTKFLGVYAGRIHGQSEVGRVWRPRLIPEILQNV